MAMRNRTQEGGGWDGGPTAGSGEWLSLGRGAKSIGGLEGGGSALLPSPRETGLDWGGGGNQQARAPSSVPSST